MESRKDTDQEAFDILNRRSTEDLVRLRNLCDRILAERFGGMPTDEELWLAGHGDKLLAIIKVKQRLNLSTDDALKVLSVPNVSKH